MWVPHAPLSSLLYVLQDALSSLQLPGSCPGPHSHVTKAKRGWFSCPGVTGFVTHKVLDLSSLTIPAGHRPAPIQVSCKGCPRAQDSLISAAVSVNERKEPSGHYGLLKGWWPNQASTFPGAPSCIFLERTAFPWNNKRVIYLLSSGPLSLLFLDVIHFQDSKTLFPR